MAVKVRRPRLTSLVRKKKVQVTRTLMFNKQRTNCAQFKRISFRTNANQRKIDFNHHITTAMAEGMQRWLQRFSLHRCSSWEQCRPQMGAVVDEWEKMQERLAQSGLIFWTPGNNVFESVPEQYTLDVNTSELRKFTIAQHVTVYNRAADRFYEKSEEEFKNLLTMDVVGFEQSLRDARLAAVVPEGSSLGRAMLNLEMNFSYADPREHTVQILLTFWGHEVSSEGVL